MTGMTRTSVLTAAVGLWLCSAALAQDYEIRLHRPVKVGQEYQMSATGRETQKMTAWAGAQVIKSEVQEMAVEIEASAKVLEVDKNGAASKESIMIGKCLEVKGEAKTPLLPAGAVVVASLDASKEPVFEIDGQKVGPQAHKALSLVFSLGKGGVTDDQVFGTPDRKKVGDQWAMNSQLAADDLKETGLAVKKEDVTGAVTLEKVVKAADGDCLQLAVTMEIAKVVPPAPPGFAVEKGTLRAQMSGKFPVNPALQSPEKSDSMTITFVMKGKPQPDAPEVVVETVAERQTTCKYAYPK